MGFWRNLSDNVFQNRDIELNSIRIEDIEGSLRELRSVRASILPSEKHKLFKINYDIGELNNKLYKIREDSDSFHEKNYSPEPEAYTKNLGKPTTAKKILVLVFACCFVAMVIVAFF